MEKWKGRVALVTGGSKGIGLAISKSLVTLGLTVYSCARDITPLKSLATELTDQQGKLNPLVCDLEDEAQILDMFRIIEGESGCVDVLINNCGIWHRKPLLTSSKDIMQSMMKVNILAVCICNREAVKLMQKQNREDGVIININSTSGSRVSSDPGLHFYSATKFALHALTDGLRGELKEIKSKIRVTSITPGLTDTPGNPDEIKEANMKKVGGILDPQDVADAVTTVLSSPPHVHMHDIHLRPIWH